MYTNNYNRRDVMQVLALTLCGTVLLPELSVAKGIDHPRTVFIPSGAGKKGKMGVNDLIFKLDKSQTNGNLGSAEITLQPGLLGSIPHYHNNFDEVCIVLEGVVNIKIEDEVYRVTAGDGI